MQKQWAKAVCAVVCIGLLAAAGFAAIPKELEIGKTAPAFDLKGVDGKQHVLADVLKKEDTKAVVVVFTCNTCPVAVAYEDRLIQLQKDYAGKGVRFVAINSNHPEYGGNQETLEKMKERATEKKFNFPYVQDLQNKIADAYGALTTPHIYVVNKEGKLVYRGAVDDNQNPKNATKQHLRAALDAFLSGKAIETPTTKAFGCTIKRIKAE